MEDFSLQCPPRMGMDLASLSHHSPHQARMSSAPPQRDESPFKKLFVEHVPQFGVLPRLPSELCERSLSFCPAETLARLSCCSKRECRMVSEAVETFMEAYKPNKKRIRRTTQGLSYLQHEPVARTDFSAVVSHVAKHSYMTKLGKGDLRKVEAGSILFLDLTKRRHVLDLCFVEAAWTHYKKGTDITVHLTVVSQKDRPLLEMRLDTETVVAVFTPIAQDRYVMPPTKYAHLLGRTGMIDWPRPNRCAMKFIDEMAGYSDPGKCSDKVRCHSLLF
jgi:hypothetical protein